MEPGGTGVRNRGWNLGVQGLGTGGGTWGYRGLKRLERGTGWEEERPWERG